MGGGGGWYIISPWVEGDLQWVLMGRRVLRRVLRRGSKKGLSRRHLSPRRQKYAFSRVRPPWRVPYFRGYFREIAGSGSPKPHPSKPHPCNMPQAKTEVALQFWECCAAEVALQHSLFCNAAAIFAKSCTAASEKLQCNIEKAALQESGAFLPLSCGFPAPTS